MEDTDDTVEEWGFGMSPRGFLPGFESAQCLEKSFADVFSGSELGTDHLFMSNLEVNFGEDEYRVNAVDNALVNDGVLMNEKCCFIDSSDIVSSGSLLPRLALPSIGPNELLDSPIMLPNSQLSPTTGTMNFPPPENGNSMLKSTSISSDKEHDGEDVSSYELKPPWPGYPPSQTQNFQTEDVCQSLLPVQSLADYKFLPPHENSRMMNTSGLESATDSNLQFRTALIAAADTEMKENREIVQLKDVKREQSSAAVHKGVYSPTKTSEDGYNWRKYGQKQVKGSDYPRSYYKCTHLTCPVKKKVERSHDGEITEIIYKGAHNHPKPQPSRRSTFGSDIQYPQSDVTEITDPHSNNQKSMAALETAETLELSSTLASHDEEEDITTQGSLSDDDEMETETKRRKKERFSIESALSSRALREPRVIVQIESEIDIVDDGYRWRKYGQKVVKGNPNPRSYYKCTSAGCTVRKHVERASHDLKFVLTTYEGKHNHVVPAARNSNNTNSSNGNLPSSSSASQSSLSLPRNSHLPKAEPQEFVPSFDRKMDYDSQLFRSDYLGTPSFYHQWNFPALPSYSSFGLSHNYTSSAQSMIPSIGNLSIPLPLPLPVNYQAPSSFSMGGYNHHRRPLSPVPPFFMGQQMNDSDVKLLRPKQEQRD